MSYFCNSASPNAQSRHRATATIPERTHICTAVSFASPMWLFSPTCAALVDLYPHMRLFRYAFPDRCGIEQNISKIPLITTRKQLITTTGRHFLLYNDFNAVSIKKPTRPSLTPGQDNEGTASGGSASAMCGATSTGPSPKSQGVSWYAAVCTERVSKMVVREYRGESFTS